MALVAFLLGSVLGLISAVLSLVFGLSLLSAFGVYMGVATILPLVMIFGSQGGTTGPDDRSHREPRRLQPQSA